MDKILSKDTIKNVFSALGAKTSDSNYGVALLDKTSGEPKGFMGMSDLASVLGETWGFKYTGFTLQAQESITLPAYYGIYMIRNNYSTDGAIIYPKYSDNNITVMSDPNSELNNRFTLTKPAAGAMTIKNVTESTLGFQVTILCASAM